MQKAEEAGVSLSDDAVQVGFLQGQIRSWELIYIGEKYMAWMRKDGLPTDPYKTNKLGLYHLLFQQLPLPVFDFSFAGV